MKKPINLLQLSSRQSTLAFLLSSAHRELFDTHSLIIEHSFADGLFCHRENWEPISQNEIDKLSAKIDKWLKNEKEIELTTAPLSKLIAIFEKEHLKNKPINLRKWNVNPVPAVRFGQHIDYRIQPMETDKKLLKFEIQKYNNGLLLRFPTITHPNSIPPFQDCQRLFSIIEEYEQWGTIIGVESIPHLNEHIHKNGIKELVWISEGLHEKKISQIADALVEEFPKKRVIYIAGPTSSGKTTFAKRLSIHIKVNGFNTHQLSMDDYFVGRGEIPFDENGFQNYEAFDVLDRNLLCERINRMLNGDEIPIRKFDFNQGKSFDFEEFVKLEDNDFIKTSNLIRNDLMNINNSILNSKKSIYNKDVYIDKLKNGKDLILGVRNKTQRFSEWVFKVYTKIVFSWKDPLCGMKGYSMKLYQDRGGFDTCGLIGTELAIFALLKKYSYEEVNIHILDREDTPKFASTIRSNLMIMKALVKVISGCVSKDEL